MNRSILSSLLLLIALVTSLTIPTPAAAAGSITVRVRSLESASPFGNETLIVVRIRQNFGSRLTAGAVERAGNLVPGTFNEYSLTVPLNENFIPGQSYQVEAWIGNDSNRRSRYYGEIVPAPTLTANNPPITVTTSNQERDIPEVSAGLVALAVGLALVVVSAGLLIWRQLRMRPLLRPLP